MTAKKTKVEFTSEGIEILLESVLNNIEDDIEEATQNIALYKTEVVNNPLGKEQFGHLMNEALKIKGSTRDRLLKTINIIRDRVKLKELLSNNKGGLDMAPEKMLAMLDQYMENEAESSEESDVNDDTK